MKLTTLFSPEKIGNVEIKNRIIRSATYTRSATDDGYVTDDLIQYYTDLAKGGVGLIITGIISIDESGKAGRGQACLYHDSYIEGQTKLVKAVHDFSEVKVAPQLSHAGRQGRIPVAPSPVLYQVNKKMPKELTEEEIQDIIKSFINAGRRAYESEYDIIQLNAGHGWLLCNFLSPYTNKRNDKYGGNIENRVRILVDIYNGITDELGKDFPIILKLQTQDFVEGGLTLNEGRQIAKILVDTGYAAIEPSGGSGDTLLNPGKTYPSIVIKTSEEQNYFLPVLNELKPIMKTSKVILMGGVRDPSKAEELLQDKKIDFIAMSRPLICEPDLPNKWKNGDLSRPLCTSCNSCYMSILSGPVKCTIKRKLLRERKKVLNHIN
jgi:2,4-dienoyl-CoA reductase-like NADH-dependent reductase (Old Yellow Enzyme family)